MMRRFIISTLHHISIIMVIKLKSKRWKGYEECMGRMKNSYTTLDGKSEKEESIWDA
jgi:hypothetical protein